jgi:hypothetical protein
MWRAIVRHPAVFSGLILTITNVAAISGLWQPGEKVLGAVNTTTAAVLALFVSVAPSFQRALVTRRYLKKAQYNPRGIVPTAAAVEKVVGRDELCYVLVEHLSNSVTRSPHVVVGGVGMGKTALIVRLVELLARAGGVPVPVELRDAQEKLDFRELARERFLAEVGDELPPDDDGEKLWRRLLQDERIIILADGLERALIESGERKDREHLFRLAMRRANEQQLPLIITSLSHHSFPTWGTVVFELEPLSEEAAVQYLQEDPSQDKRQLDWIVETGEIAEAPLYLQITRQLDQRNLIDQVWATRDGGGSDTPSIDRTELRLRLLDTWTQALIRGHFLSHLPLNRDDRQAIVEQLSALACIGVIQDSLYVNFEDLEGRGGPASQLSPPSAITKEVERRLQNLDRRFDMRLAAGLGMQLGLVEAEEYGVRFLNSIMQAYLGSRFLDVALMDPRYRSEALQNGGREFLLALAMHSRVRVKKARPDDGAGNDVDIAGRKVEDVALPDLLRAAATHHSDVKAVQLYAAALETDSVGNAVAHAAIADEIENRWRYLWARDQRTLEEAKFDLVRRFGEAARTIAERRRTKPDYPGRPAYRQLYRIGCADPSYLARLAVTLEIGTGSDDALDALEGVLGPGDTPDMSEEQLGGPDAGQHGYGRSELRTQLVPRFMGGDYEQELRWRENIMRATLAPLLVGSVANRERDARKNLEEWLKLVETQDHSRGDLSPRISLEMALAQGFKHAANRRRRHPHAQPEARAYLTEQTRQMLRRTSFWFSRLTLVQALCLWALPDDPLGQPFGGVHDIDPKARVRHWLADPNPRPEHPFVVEACRLAVWALEIGQPERFIWMDEVSVVARIGSQPASSGSRRMHNLWIPSSTGWTALHPRAQQLIADVLLLLNLAERGTQSYRDRRLQRTDRNDLPPCLAADRSPLDPNRTIGMVTTSEPGSNCKDGCRVGLCPYPPQGELPYRGELSQLFCRRQQLLVEHSRVRRKTAPWQEVLPGESKRFWRQMEQRTRPLLYQ